MTQQPQFAPPPMAEWLVSLFASSEDAEFMMGDLCEEFSQRASSLGIRSARAWYWRQSLKTIAHLYAAGFRDAPAWTIALAAGGFLLHRFVSGLPGKAPAAVTGHYLAYWSAHFEAYRFLASDGMLLAHLAGSLLVGFVLALAARGREMVVATTLALTLSAMIVAAWVWIPIHGPILLGAMLWPCGGPLAIVLGGAIVRTWRSTALSLFSGA